MVIKIQHICIHFIQKSWIHSQDLYIIYFLLASKINSINMHNFFDIQAFNFLNFLKQKLKRDSNIC